MAISFVSLLLLSAVPCFTDASSPPSWFSQRNNHTALAYNRKQLAALCRQNSHQRIKKYLKQISVPRPIGSSNHTKVLNYLKKVANQLGFQVETHSFKERTVVGERTFTNLIATAYPAAPRRLVLACHYDSKDFSYMNTGGEFEGATDAALPCALLLDVAQTLRPYFHAGIPNDLSLQLMFFDGEESFKDWSRQDSLYGSRKLAADLAARVYAAGASSFVPEISRIDALILLDLLGAQGCKIFNYAVNDAGIYKYLLETENKLKTVNGCLPGTYQIFQRNRVLNIVIADDHLPFKEHGVPVVHVIPAEFPLVWHTLMDTTAALHWPTIGRLAAILRVFVARYLRLAV